MFWKSIYEGFVVLRHWEIWLGLLAFVALNWGFLALTGLLMRGENAGGKRTAAGCIMGTVGYMAWFGLCVGFFVVLFSPILLGGDGLLPLRAVPHVIGPTVKASFLGTVAAAVLLFVPVVGHLLETAPGISIFLIGSFVFRGMSWSVIDFLWHGKVKDVELYPGFWASAGYLIIGTVVMFGVILVLSVLAAGLDWLKGHRGGYSPYGDLDEGPFQGWATVLAIVIAPLLGLLPVFMYAAYARLNLQAALEQGT